MYGDAFKVEEFKDGMFWLTSTKSEEKAEVVEETETLVEETADLQNISTLTDEEMNFEFDFDDLPF
jgi:hypothetical protein